MPIWEKVVLGVIITFTSTGFIAVGLVVRHMF
jgi:hypothetical protein